MTWGAQDAAGRAGAESGWESYGTMLGFGLSIPVFFATTYGWVLWIVMPILVARVDRLRRRGTVSSDGAGPVGKVQP